MSAPAVELPATDQPVAGSRSLSTRLHLAYSISREWLAVALVVVGRSLATLVMVIRLGLKWEAWAEGTGIAKRRSVQKSRRTTDNNGNGRREHYTVQQLRGVPKRRVWQVTQHGVTLRVKVPDGADRASFAPAMGPLRHTARAQSATVRELPGKPGYLAVDVLRRDPLSKVALVPRAVGRDQFCVSLDEHGRRCVLDLAGFPHWLFVGASNAGKSSWVNALASSMAPTTDVLAMVDLKWGLEAQVLGPRWSKTATTAEQASALFDEVLTVAGHRASILARLMCQDVGQLEERYGVELRRIRVFVDEVAELGGSEEALDKMASIASRARALGINLLVSGQRFGADQGKKVTTVRGQLSGRVICRVNDVETAKMAMPGVDEDTRTQLLNISRAGVALVQQGSTFALQRPAYRPLPTLRRLGEAHAHQALNLTAVPDDDTARTEDLTPQLDPIGA